MTSSYESANKIVSPERVRVKDGVNIWETVPAQPSSSLQLFSREPCQAPAWNSSRQQMSGFWTPSLEDK